MSNSKNNPRRRGGFSSDDLKAQKVNEALHPIHGLKMTKPKPVRNLQCPCNGECGYKLWKGRAVQSYVVLDRTRRTSDLVQCNCKVSQSLREAYFGWHRAWDKYEDCIKVSKAELASQSKTTMGAVMRGSGLIRDTRSGKVGVAHYRTNAAGARVLATVVPFKAETKK
jgi:hypothetical protein